jgi:glycosyltransferase involved in cell wall biosynthesis
LTQSFIDFEIIVVDDASTDNTQMVVKGFEDRRLRYIRHSVNQGEGGARNTGVTSAMGDYIGFLDDDDEWLPTKLQLQVEVLNNSSKEIGAVYTGASHVDLQKRKPLGNRLNGKNGDVFHQLIRREYSIMVSSILIRKRCFERVGLFDEGIPYGLDYDMWLRMSQEFKFAYINRPLVKYGVHDNKMGRNWKLQVAGREALIRKYGPAITLDNKGYSRWLKELGILYYLSGDKKKGKAALLQAIKLSPYSIQRYGVLCLCMLGVQVFNRVLVLRRAFRFVGTLPGSSVG